MAGQPEHTFHDLLPGACAPTEDYYPVPAHRQKMFEAFGGQNFDLEITDWLTERVISLPIHTEMDEDQLAYITENVLSFINKTA